MSRQRQMHNDLWGLYVAACGNQCCVCGRTDRPLFRGHIERDADGGTGDLSNLIPICKPCNSEQARMPYTPRHIRPADWKARFIKALIEHFDLHTLLKRQFTSLGVVKSAENKIVIDLADLDFAPQTEVLTLIGTPAPCPRSDDDLRAAVLHLINLGRSHPVPLIPPTDKVRARMMELAKTETIPTFLAAGREFIRREQWFEDNGYGHTRHSHNHEWEILFCSNIEIHIADARDRARELALARAEEKKRQDEAARLAAQEAERQRQPVTDEVRQSALAPRHRRLAAIGKLPPKEQQAIDSLLETPAIETVGEFEDRLSKLDWRLHNIERLRKLAAMRVAECAKERREPEADPDPSESDPSTYLPELPD